MAEQVGRSVSCLLIDLVYRVKNTPKLTYIQRKKRLIKIKPYFSDFYPRTWYALRYTDEIDMNFPCDSPGESRSVCVADTRPTTTRRPIMTMAINSDDLSYMDGIFNLF